DRNSSPIGAIAMLVLVIVAPLAAMIIQLAISRSREYEADKSAGLATNDPLSLSDALKKLAEGVKRVPLTESSATTAHMFIVNPLKGESLLSLFSTHPPIAERVKRLENLNNEIKGYNIPKIVR
ncbi:MAG: M48 family metalloprotease, partial [Endomicrobiia bacterium]